MLEREIPLLGCQVYVTLLRSERNLHLSRVTCYTTKVVFRGGLFAKADSPLLAKDWGLRMSLGRDAVRQGWESRIRFLQSCVDRNRSLSVLGLAERQRAALFPFWLLGIAGAANGIAHPLLSVIAGGYFPGLLHRHFSVL